MTDVMTMPPTPPSNENTQQTPLGFTSLLLDSLSQTRSSLDAFVTNHRGVLESIAATTQNCSMQSMKELNELNKKLENITGEDGAQREKNAANAQKLADESARIAKLQSDCDELGGEQMEMLKNEAVEAEANKVLTVKARQKAEKSNETTMALLNKSIVAYRESLSLDFERAEGNKLRLTFTNINEASLTEAHSFTLNVNSAEEYEIENCQPELDGGLVDALLEEVNKTNNFGEFVKNVRKAFVGNVEGGF